ncbi:biosynthesis protein PigD [Pseudoalteromonas rubra]|uniref:biosynthesis protein PigD n=1 Tax=Pseudoalteromonas rubra TaxID=43658 RepID=UPI000F78CC86|nr:biosynthesis protein PigD [Pseudoalteromonas rubra]
MTSITGLSTQSSVSGFEHIWQAETPRTGAKQDTITVGVIVVTRDEQFFHTGLSVLSDIREYVFNRVHIQSELVLKNPSLVPCPLYDEVRDKAIHFLKGQKKAINIQVIQCASLAEATGKIIHSNALSEQPDFQVGMLFYDQTSMGFQDDSIDQIDRDLDAFYRAMQKIGIPAFYTSFSTVTFIRALRTPYSYLPQQYREIVRSTDPATFQTELLRLWMDFFEMNYANRRVKPVGSLELHNTLGDQLINFFARTAPEHWLVSYYTGSVVSNLIGHLDRHAEKQGALVLRGPNEHAIACGAIANWQLYRMPFLAVVTSGMMDEFKGTLANLKETAAQGIIVVAENRLSQWYSFQGTITASEDMREVLAAKRIPYVYMDEIEQIGENLAEVYRLYHQGQGPVVVLATQNVLESSLELDLPALEALPASPSDEPVEVMTDELRQAIELINNGPEKLVWQLGPVSEDEYALIHDIAQQAGIALVDSLAHPGTAPKYYQGKRNDNYLGTLAIYGYTPRVYNYFHTKDKLNSTDEQCLFMLKSRVAQIATPFSDGRLERKVHLVQLTKEATHLSPFADLHLHMRCRDFLQAVKKHLNVSESLRARRMARIMAYPDTQSDVLSKLPSLPMSPNYFFCQLNRVIEDLIEHENFDYTGVYDVGRCGISAVRNVAKTRRGFSGWYGRALMGDALLASGYLAYTSPSNVIAFIGDGAKGIVPDILPAFIDNILTHPQLLDKSISVFYFCNGGLSVINTYQERILFNRTSRQMRLVNIEQPQFEQQIGDFDISAQTLTQFDETAVRTALTAQKRLTLFSVVLGHNNEGDGISLATAKGWQRDSAEPVTPDTDLDTPPAQEVNS